jgi:hypothetical protein
MVYVASFLIFFFSLVHEGSQRFFFVFFFILLVKVQFLFIFFLIFLVALSRSLRVCPGFVWVEVVL